MDINSTNLTLEEKFSIFGTLPAQDIETLLDNEDNARANVQAFNDAKIYAREAAVQYPAEDFLNDPITKLQDLAKRLRGDNRAALLAIIESLDDIAQTTFHAADYGCAELAKIA